MSRWTKAALVFVLLALVMNGTAKIANGGKMPCYIPGPLAGLFHMNASHKLADANTRFSFLCDQYVVMTRNACAVISLGDISAFGAFACILVGLVKDLRRKI